MTHGGKERNGNGAEWVVAMNGSWSSFVQSVRREGGGKEVRRRFVRDRAGSREVCCVLWMQSSVLVRAV